MTHKIPAHLIDTDGHRIESHQLMTSGPGMTAEDIEAARRFLERRAEMLGLQLAGQWHMSNGEIRVWAKRDPHQAAEADAFRLTIQAGPAAADTTGDLFGIPADLAADVASRCDSHRRTRPAEGADLFAGA